MRSIQAVTFTSLASVGVSHFLTVEFLQIATLGASFIYSMFKLWLDYKNRNNGK